MTLKAIAAQQLGNPKELYEAVRELQGLKQELVTGAAAGTAMACGAISPEDTILSAIVFTDAAAAALTNDKANITIQSRKATGTVTIAGNPVADETVTVNGNVYTWKAVPTAKNHVKITAGDNTQMATDLAAAINAYEGRYESQLHGDGNRTPSVVASSALGVVTVTAVTEGSGGNAITLAEASTNVTVSGATLAGGSDTGALKSTTNLTGKHVLVSYFDKK